jgi:hypothetical protein
MDHDEQHLVMLVGDRLLAGEQGVKPVCAPAVSSSAASSSDVFAIVEPAPLFR